MLTISELASAYRDRQTRPSEVMRNLLERIEATPFNCFISVDREDVLRQAAAADQALDSGLATGALHGVPIAVKDLIDVAGMRTTMGSEQFAANVAQADAVVVERLRAQGAIIVGKANTHEFAYGSSGDRSYFGAARNPHNPNHMTGGSSSGSAAALAAGLCCGALGTDTSASIRLPAALCGVVGLKPTFDLLPRDGVFGLSGSLDHVGPMTGNVRDNALMLDALVGGAGETYGASIGRSIRGKTVGLAMGFYNDPLSDAVRRALDDACAVFEAAGARVVPVDVPNILAIFDAQQLILKAEAYAQHRDALLRSAPYQEEVRERLLTGADVLAADYLRALALRPLAVDSFDEVLSKVDILLSPTCGTTAPPIDQRVTPIAGVDHRTPWLLTRLTAPTNFSGHPSLSVPFGTDHAGLPIGMQLMGRLGDEATLYQYGDVLERG